MCSDDFSLAAELEVPCLLLALMLISEERGKVGCGKVHPVHCHTKESQSAIEISTKLFVPDTVAVNLDSQLKIIHKFLTR